MPKKSFKGVAYWSVDTTTDLWAAKAKEVLLPLEAAGLGEVAYDCLAAGDQVTVTMGGEQHQLLINGGKGRGVVRPSPTAGLFVVCLVALRKRIGGIDVVDDEQKAVPTMPRQSAPLYRENWQSVVSIAEALGVANLKAGAAMRRLLV